MTMTFIRASAHETGLPDKSVQAIITSPPFYGLRKYSGEQDIDWPAVEYAPMPGLDALVSVPAMRAALGNEPTLDAYVGHLVLCLREWRRVLRDDGLAFVNLGDSYAGNNNQRDGTGETRNLKTDKFHGGRAHLEQKRNTGNAPGLLPKSLLQVPARFALAAQAEGWYLRSDLIGAKVAPMPESTKDRPTRSHEHVFMLAKSARYYSDMLGVAEDATNNGKVVSLGKKSFSAGQAKGAEIEPSGNGKSDSYTVLPTRNMRDVFEWRPAPFSAPATVDHFATWPEAVPERFIRMSTSPHGCCPACGAAWRRVVENPKIPDEIRNRGTGAKMDFHTKSVGGGQKVQDWRDANPSQTIGWVPTCECTVPDLPPYTGPVPYPTVPCVVLDPFSGSGATCKAAARIGRDAIGIDVCEQYLEDVTAARMGDGFQMELTRC